MLRRSTKIQLILFVVVTLLGVSYVSASYIGLTDKVFNSGCTPKADFVDSGGIFTNAEVTYRGVTVGKVGAINLRPGGGVRVELDIKDCSSTRVPENAKATVADRSVVGEQYVNLEPTGNEGPFLSSKTVIPQSRTAVPTPTKTLLVNLNRLIQSVPLDDLKTTVDELGTALNGRGDDLSRLLDSTSLLIKAAQQNLPETISLIDNSATVLDTQLAVAPSLQSFTHSLRLLSAQLKKSDPDIRRLLDHGPTDLQTVQDFVKDNRTDFGVLLANLSTVGDIVVSHLDGVEEVLELYPALAAGGQSVLRPTGGGHNKAQLGLVLQPPNLSNSRDLGNDPPDCGDPKQDRQGYNGTRRQPGELSPQRPNVAARCTAPVSSGTNVRGAANVPGGDPISTSGGDVAYPRPLSQNTTQVDTSLLHTNLGDGSWVALLTAGTH